MWNGKSLTVFLNSSQDKWLNALWPSVKVDPSLAVLCVSISSLLAVSSRECVRSQACQQGRHHRRTANQHRMPSKQVVVWCVVLVRGRGGRKEEGGVRPIVQSSRSHFWNESFPNMTRKKKMSVEKQKRQIMRRESCLAQQTLLFRDGQSLYVALSKCFEESRNTTNFKPLFLVFCIF